MFDFIIIILLIFGMLIGLKRGFILQLFHLIGFIIAFIVAVKYYDLVAERLALWIPYPEFSNDNMWAGFLQSLPLKNGFYNAIAFALIFFVVKIILHIIASMLDFVASLPVLHTMNKLLGAILGFLEIYLILFIILYILALTPIGGIQTWMNNSSIAFFMIEHTPYLSDKVKDLWFTSMDNIM